MAYNNLDLKTYVQSKNFTHSNIKYSSIKNDQILTNIKENYLLSINYLTSIAMLNI